MTMVKINLTTLKPLHIIGNLLGIWPTFDTNTMSKCGRHYVYGIIALIIIICIHMYTLIEKITWHDKVDDSVFVMMLLSDIATTTTNITSIVNINFLQSDRLYKFLQELKNLEAIFQYVNCNSSSQKRNFYLHILMAHFVFIIYVMYNLWEWTHTLGWAVSQYTLLRDVQFYHVGISVMLVRSYVLLIKYKVEALNYVLEHHQLNNPTANVENVIALQKLLENGKNANVCNQINNLQIITVNQQWDLEYIGKVYTKLTNVVNEFNEIFGWNLVVFIIQLIINLLLALNLAFVYGGGTKILDTTLDYNLYVLCFIWFVIPLVRIYLFLYVYI